MAMGQKESARASLAARVVRILFTLIFTVVSLLFEGLMSYQQNLTAGPEHSDR